MLYFELRRKTSRFLMVLTGLAVLLFGAVDTPVLAAIELAIFGAALLWGLRRLERPFTLLGTTLYAPFVVAIGAGVYQLAVGRGASPYATAAAVALWLAYLLFFALALHCQADPWIRRESMYWLSAGGGVLGILAVGQTLLRPGAALALRTAPGVDPLGPFAQAEHLTVVFELLFPLSLLAALEAKQEVWRWYLAAAAMAAGVVAGGSLLGLVILGGEVVIFMAVRMFNIRRELQRDAGQALTSLTGLTLSALVLLLGAALTAPARPPVTLANTVPLADPQMRFAAERMFRAEPIVGHGLGAFETAFTSYSPVEQRSRWTHLESDPAQMALELGIPGAACQALFAGLALLLTLGLSRRAWLGALLPLAAAWTHSWTGSPFAAPGVALIALLLLARIPAEGLRRTRRRRRVDGEPIGSARGAPIY